MDQIKVGKYISELRRNLGLTQSQLGEKVGVTAKAVSKWETGRNMPDLSIIEELGTILNVSVSELLKGENLNNFSQTEIVETSIDSIKYYTNQNKKRIIKKVSLISIITIILFMIVTFSVLFYTNNYNNCFVYELLSQDSNYAVEGIIIYTPKKSIIAFNSLSNAANYDLDLEEAYDYEFSLLADDEILYREGNISAYEYNEDDAKSILLNDVFSEISIYINEDKNYRELYSKNIDDKLLTLEILYLDKNLNHKQILIPMKLNKVFSNDSISYDGGKEF